MFLVLMLESPAAGQCRDAGDWPHRISRQTLCPPFGRASPGTSVAALAACRRPAAVAGAGAGADAVAAAGGGGEDADGRAAAASHGYSSCPSGVECHRPCLLICLKLLSPGKLWCSVVWWCWYCRFLCPLCGIGRGGEEKRRDGGSVNICPKPTQNHLGPDHTHDPAASLVPNGLLLS